MESGEVTLNATLHFGSTIPIVGLDPSQSTAVITNLVFCSAWMGALGWELLMTLLFDVRLVRQTNWRSVASTIHTLAYYCSRYTTIAYIALFVVINSLSVSLENVGVCERRVSAAAVLFVISQCSILLVFVMRTLALWNLDMRVSIPLILVWLGALGINLTIPAYGHGMPLGNFCVWSIKGGWVGSSMIAMALASLLCLILTIVKLNKQGWRGLIQSMLPSTTRSIDAEDVSRILVQRTTCFFIVMLASIVVADIVYFTATFPIWQLIGVPAYLAIAASLAGRLFRRSWKITHSAEYNRPPSYHTGNWRHRAATGDDAEVSDMPFAHAARTVAFADPFAGNANVSSQPHLNRSDETFSFVEGQFRGLALNAPSFKSIGLQSPTAEKAKGVQVDSLSMTPDAQRRRASEPANIVSQRLAHATYGYDEREIAVLPSDQVVLDMDGDVSKSERSVGVFGISEAPAFVQRNIARPLNTRQGSGSVFAEPNNSLISKSSKLKRSQRPVTEPQDIAKDTYGNEKPIAWVYPWLTPPGTATSRPDTASSSEGPSSSGNSHHRDARWSTLDVSTMPIITKGTGTPARDDLASAPNQPQLWLDSSAERARMEAAANRGLAGRANETDVGYAPSYAGLSSHASTSSLRSPHSTGSSGRGTTSKRMIVESTHEAAHKLSQKEQARPIRRMSESMMAARANLDRTTRITPPQTATGQAALRSAAYLASPAIISTTHLNDLRNDRSTFDLDAIRRSLAVAAIDKDHGQSSSRLTGPLISSVADRFNGAPSQQARPRTAPGKVNGRRDGSTLNGASRLRTGDDGADPVVAEDEDNLLTAFRSAVNEDIDRRFVDERPRTSRGGSFSGGGGASFVPQPVREASPGGGGGAAPTSTFGIRRTGSAHEDRPRTRSGADGETVKPFGFGLGSPSSSGNGAAPATSQTIASSAANVSAIEEQYRKLQALAERQPNGGSYSVDSTFADRSAHETSGSSTESHHVVVAVKPLMAPLERIDSRSTEENMP